MGFTPVYPPAHSDTYVKATSRYTTSYEPWFATNPAQSLTGSSTSTEWQSSTYAGQKLRIDFASSKVIKRIYLENSHSVGGITDYGIKDFEVYGSDTYSAFTSNTYSDVANCTLLGTFQAAAHVGSDTTDPQYFDLSSNSTGYIYYIIRIANNWGGYGRISIRHINLQIEDLTGIDGTLSLTGPGPAFDAVGDSTVPSFVSIYPTLDSNHVKASHSTDTAVYTCDPSKDLIGVWDGQQWVTDLAFANMKFNVDFGTPIVLKRLYLENSHSSGNHVNSGIENFIVYGTNSATAFNNTDFASTTDLTEIDTLVAAAHIAGSVEDPQYFYFPTNTLAFQYYVLRIIDNHGSTLYSGIRRLEFQVDENLIDGTLELTGPDTTFEGWCGLPIGNLVLDGPAAFFSADDGLFPGTLSLATASYFSWTADNTSGPIDGVMTLYGVNTEFSMESSSELILMGTKPFFSATGTTGRVGILSLRGKAARFAATGDCEIVASFALTGPKSQFSASGICGGAGSLGINGVKTSFSAQGVSVDAGDSTMSLYGSGSVLSMFGPIIITETGIFRYQRGRIE